MATAGATRRQVREETELRDERALELHVAGLTYDAIAKQLNYSDRSAAKKARDRAFDRHKAMVDDKLSDWRRMQRIRLDRLFRAAYPIAIGQLPPELNPQVAGKPDPNREAAVRAWLTSKLAAIRECRALVMEEARLLGTLAPVRVTVTDEMDAEIEELMGMIAELGPVAEGVNS